MNQGELAFAIYGDNRHMPNIYSALTSLVNEGLVKRTGNNPSLYSLIGTKISIPEKTKKVKNDRSRIDVITRNNTRT